MYIYIYIYIYIHTHIYKSVYIYILAANRPPDGFPASSCGRLKWCLASLGKHITSFEIKTARTRSPLNQRRRFLGKFHVFCKSNHKENNIDIYYYFFFF